MNDFVWVAGSRTLRRAGSEIVSRVLDAYHRRYTIRRLVTGAASGVDTLAENWARQRAVPYVGVGAAWKTQLRAAGPRRNERIAAEEKPDILLAFPGGSGTESAIQTAIAYGIPVLRVDDNWAEALERREDPTVKRRKD